MILQYQGEKKMEECIFCKIINGQLPAKFEYQDDMVVAFKDINPQAPVHILIVPKEHIPTILDIAEQKSQLLLESIFSLVKKLAAAHNLEERGFRVVINCKHDAGQEVYHLHFHLLGGRKFSWPPG